MLNVEALTVLYMGVPRIFCKGIEYCHIVVPEFYEGAGLSASSIRVLYGLQGF